MSAAKFDNLSADEIGLTFNDLDRIAQQQLIATYEKRGSSNNFLPEEVVELARLLDERRECLTAACNLASWDELQLFAKAVVETIQERDELSDLPWEEQPLLDLAESRAMLEEIAHRESKTELVIDALAFAQSNIVILAVIGGSTAEPRSRIECASGESEDLICVYYCNAAVESLFLLANLLTALGKEVYIREPDWDSRLLWEPNWHSFPAHRTQGGLPRV